MGEQGQLHSERGQRDFGCDHFVVHTDIELQCCTPKTYTMLCTNFTSIKKSIGYKLWLIS